MKLNTACFLAITLAMTLTSAFTSAYAADNNQLNTERFNERKAKILENHDKRMQTMTQGKSCIQAATTPAQIHACHEEEQQARKTMRHSMKEQHKAMKAQHKEHMEHQQ